VPAETLPPEEILGLAASLDQASGHVLAAAVVRAAAERGCRHAHLDTFSYQARPFYERLGYRLFGELENYPPGHSRFFLRKQL
jgi:cation transport ATPase